MLSDLDMSYQRKIMRCIFLGLLVIASIAPNFAEEKRLPFEGSWCRNSCYYGSNRNDPPHLPCQIDFVGGSVRWDEGNKHFERRYSVAEHTTRSATLIVEGGNKRAWHSHKSARQMRWKFLFDVDPQIPDALLPVDTLNLSAVPYCVDSHNCEKDHGETYYLLRRTGACS